MPFPNICVIRTCEWATDRVVLVGRSVGRLVGCTLSFGECSIEYVFEFFFLFFFYFRFPFLRSSRLYSNTYSTFWWKTSVVKCYYWLLLCAHLAHSNSSVSYVHICKWLGKKTHRSRNEPKYHLHKRQIRTYTNIIVVVIDIHHRSIKWMVRSFRVSTQKISGECLVFITYYLCSSYSHTNAVWHHNDNFWW